MLNNMSLRDNYKTIVVPKLVERFGQKNKHSVVGFEKITINIGLGPGLKDAKYLEATEKTLQSISGQRPVKTKARKAISTFKTREGMVIGMKVTLRGKRMWYFLDKLIHITFPRVRDFRGLPRTGFDAHGNYSVGFREHLAFPEIHSDEIETVHGLQIVITTTAKTPEQGLTLLENLGFPFQKPL